ncbi:MAG: prepilin-type N-terminal cleavage/methylation domain-containing protein [Armatimonadetes bacterium]|nr:prepilin-type N-terminal cleavage/methylation domain-containing protein [Armatimonadota bacterium]
MGWSRRSSSGITLVEVLAVIAVIAILAAILLPIFTRSKSQSKSRKCASNLQQLGRAFHLYISDWNGAYPAPGGKPGDYNYWVQSGRGGIVRYIGTSGGLGTIWCCPELRTWQGRFPARSYSMNSFLRNPPDISYPTSIGIFDGVRECMIEDPRRTILLYEGLPITPSWPDSLDYIYRCGNWTCVRGWYTEDMPRLHTLDSWKPWHDNERNNYLYIDGHIVSRAPAKYKNNQLAPWNEMYEWWVLKTATGAIYAKLIDW